VRGREAVKVELFIPAGAGCPHDYVLTPQDRKKLTKADCLIINGAGMEEFLDNIIKESDFFVIDTSAGITNLIYYDENMNHPVGENSHHHKEVNPHFFASPSLAELIVENIIKGLSSFDVEGGVLYRKNGEVYKAKLKKLSSRMGEIANDLKNKRIITQHDAFDYFARDMGLQIIATIYTYSAQEPAATEFKKLLTLIKEKKPAAIFIEPQYSARAAKKLSQETGIMIATLDPVATGSDNASPDYYEKIMMQNLETIRAICGREQK
jgi:ABC-type Zn uptake system ZnuABC Zn-binding protein ZnuA